MVRQVASLHEAPVIRTVHLAFSSASSAFIRRTASEFPVVRHRCRFDDDIQADYGWLAMDSPRECELSTHIPRERRIFIVGEPSPMNYLPTKFINQFGVVVSPYRPTNFRGFWFASHPGLPWFFGAALEDGRLQPTFSHAQLETLQPPTKINAVSAIVSNKAVHAGHRRRLRFLELLQSKLGDRLVLFGRGIREIRDKAEAILPYAYHLALENTIEPNYWTEKLADAFLGHAFPLYAGCPNIQQWFPENSLLPLDLNNPETVVQQAVEALNSNLYAERGPFIQAARRKLLEQETIFDVLGRAIAAAPPTSERRGASERLHSAERGGWKRRAEREFLRIYRQLTFQVKLKTP